MSRVQSESHAGPMHMCDNECKAKGFKLSEIAAIVSEGGAAHTINLRNMCHNERRLKQGEEEVTASKGRELVEPKASRGE